MISEEDLEQAYWNSSQCYPWRVNQLGGRYINGKPLPFETRMQILYCARNGVRPCDISRQMKITHGCISKLLAKFKRTGSMVPGSINQKHTIMTASENDPRKTLQNIHANGESRLVAFQQNSRRDVEHTVCGVQDWAKSSIATTTLMHRRDNERLDEREEEVSSRGEEKREELMSKPYNHSIAEILCKTTRRDKKELRLKEAMFTGTYEPNARSSDVKDKYVSPTSSPRKPSQRIHFSRQQLQILNEEFMANQYPGLAERQKLANDLDVQESKIRIWFSNKRAKCRQSTSRDVQDHVISEKTSEVIELTCSTHAWSCCQCYMLQ